MQYRSLSEFTERGTRTLAPGPLALLLMEDLLETNSTIRHHLARGFAEVVVLGPESLDVSPELADRIHRVTFDTSDSGAAATAVNAIQATVPGRWIYYGYNTEYLFYPFCETRTVGEMTAFVSEEKRESILTYIIDLYAENLDKTPSGVSLDAALLDQSGYYAQARSRDDTVMERQIDLFGGLRWRCEEHIAPARRKIDRISLFRAKPGLQLRGDHTFNDEEYNTYSCPWHHNLTASICSFRVAKALKANAGSRDGIESFSWHNSIPFNWHSHQLLDLGLMEPGQWF